MGRKKLSTESGPVAFHTPRVKEKIEKKKKKKKKDIETEKESSAVSK